MTFHFKYAVAAILNTVQYGEKQKSAGSAYMRRSLRAKDRLHGSPINHHAQSAHFFVLAMLPEMGL